jgi:hypothetical protein
MPTINRGGWKCCLSLRAILNGHGPMGRFLCRAGPLSMAHPACRASPWPTTKLESRERGGTAGGDGSARCWIPREEKGMKGIRRAAGKQELEASAAGGAELEHSVVAPKAWPRGGTGGEEPEVGRGWPPPRWSPAVPEEEAGCCRAEKQVTGGRRLRPRRVCAESRRVRSCAGNGRWQRLPLL